MKGGGGGEEKTQIKNDGEAIQSISEYERVWEMKIRVRTCASGYSLSNKFHY